MFDISFVIDQRGRDFLKHIAIKNIRETFSDYYCEIIFVNQCDDGYIRQGQLKNIGSIFAHGDYVVVQDIDTYHLHNLPIRELCSNNDTVRLISERAEITLNSNGCHISRTFPVVGCCCAAFSKKNIEHLPLYSNLFRGWGGEDMIFQKNNKTITYNNVLGHISHPSNAGCGRPDTNENDKMYSAYMNGEIDSSLDGWKQTTCRYDVIDHGNGVFDLNVTKIGVVDDFAYMNYYYEFDEIEKNNKLIMH